MHYLFLPSLLAALVLPLSVIAAQLCDAQKRPVVASAWYEGWAAQNITPAMIPMNLLNRVIVAFATTTNDTSTMVSVDAETVAALKEIVQLAKKNAVSVILSVGGATGSQFFSKYVAPDKRPLFVTAMKSLLDKYDLDGIEFDWEFPNQLVECNTFSSNDSSNFLAFLQDFRKEIGSNKTITAAVGFNTFIGPDGNHMTDVSDFAKVFDHISLMGYDFEGSWSNNSGPNAALNDACANNSDPRFVDSDRFSVDSGVSNWKNAKFPVSKIVLGVPAYGHSFSVSPDDAYDSTGNIAPFAPVDRSNQPLGPGESPNANQTTDQCGQPNAISGVYNYNALFGPFLNEDGTNATGIDYTFDECSQTPFLYDPDNEVLISYDNKDSFDKKGGYIKSQGMKGFSIWPLQGDKNNSLLTAISSGMGIQQCS